MISKRLNVFLKKHNLKINYLDVGAREDLSPLWKSLEKNLNVMGFETDPVENKRLNKKFPNRRYFPFGLWSSVKTLDLFITKNPSSSSIYEPNIKRNNNYKDEYHNYRTVDKKVSVKCNYLDNTKINQLDFMKIDTQGSEYEILIGAKKLLTKNIPLVSCETWTSEVYKNVPLMHKVIEVMYDYGYEILDMELCHNSKHKNDFESYSKAISGGYEILFYKKEIDFKIDKNLIIKYILLLDLFGYRDLAMHIFNKKFNSVEFQDLKTYLIKNYSIKYNKLSFLKKILKKINVHIWYKNLFKSNFIKINE